MLKKENIYYIDNSMVSTFQECPVKYHYNYVIRKTPPKKQSALSFGAAVHVFTENLRKGIGYKPALTEAVSSYQKDYDPTSEDHRTPALLAKVCEKIEADQINTFLGYAWEGVEIPFDVPLATAKDGNPIHYCGRIDAIAIDDNQNLCIVDDKTTSIGGATTIRAYESTYQFPMYLWAAGKLLDRPINKAKVYQIKVTKSGNISLELVPLYYSWELLQEYLEDFTSLAVGMINNNIEEKSLPRHRVNCVTKFGVCPFFDICQSQPTTRGHLLDSLQDETWSPLD